jgi:hypothetical protein
MAPSIIGPGALDQHQYPVAELRFGQQRQVIRRVDRDSRGAGNTRRETVVLARVAAALRDLPG